jgi:hypothetical protein
VFRANHRLLGQMPREVRFSVNCSERDTVGQVTGSPFHRNSASAPNGHVPESRLYDQVTGTTFFITDPVDKLGTEPEAPPG